MITSIMCLTFQTLNLQTCFKDMTQFILIVGILIIALLGMGVRMLLVKNGEMRAGCAGKNPMLQEEGVACGMCGAKPGEVCKSDESEK